MKKRGRRWKWLLLLGLVLFLASFLHFGFGLGRSTMTTTAVLPQNEKNPEVSPKTGERVGADDASHSTTEQSPSRELIDSVSAEATDSSVSSASTEAKNSGPISFGTDTNSMISGNTDLSSTVEPAELSTEVSVYIHESQIYWNEQPIELVQLEENLGQLTDDQQQVKLVDVQAKRVVYQQVEELLQQHGLIIIRTTQ